MSAITEDRELLPANVKPLHYSLELEPDFTTFETNGSVTIELDVVEASTEISLHACEIKVESIMLTRDGVVEEPQSDKYDEESHVLTMTFERAMKKGSKVTLIIVFQSQLNDKDVGFYRSSYVENGTKKYVAASQMEALDARRAFPCFDEPALKATFDVTLVAEKGLTCLSNMNVTSTTEIIGGKNKVVFARSPLMSTYLIAFVVGELEYIEINTFHVPIRVYTPPGYTTSGHYALELAAKTLKFYEEAFDCPFPLPKMDMVGVHNAGGAMENWGLVIYRMNFLLYDEKTSVQNKAWVSGVVQHELAHQWFGNIVTMQFWDGLWLNEGFATWMSWYSANEFYPEWTVWQEAISDTLQKALKLDSLKSSHPVEVPVKKMSEINQIFDSISYSKGCSVIHMMAQYIGQDTFLKGIKMYLKKHAYGNALTSDLWAALDEASGKDVGKIMSVWTTKVGYPIVTVTESESGIHLKQKRFLQASDVAKEDDETLYPLFPALRTKTGIQNGVLFEGRSMDIPLEDKDFFKLNTNHYGFYRTLYTPERLNKLGQAMKSGLLSAEDRIGLVADAGALASSGHQKTTALLEFLANASTETNTFVWDQIVSIMSAVQDAWKFHKSIPKALDEFNKQLLGSRITALGWDFSNGEDMLLARQKTAIFKFAVTSGYPSAVKAALEMFSSFAAGKEDAIHPNIRQSVYSTALKQGGRKEFDFLLHKYLEIKHQDEQDDALRGLGYTEDPECVQELLAMNLTDKIKKQSIQFSRYGLTSQFGETYWTWVKHNWVQINEKLGGGLSYMGAIVSAAIRGLSKPDHVEDVETFFEKLDTSHVDLAVAQGIEALKAKIKWAERDGEEVNRWLMEKGYGA